MPNQRDYFEAAHALARGRDHRIVHKGPEVEETDREGALGAWVPIEMWITADEVEAFLKSRKLG